MNKFIRIAVVVLSLVVLTASPALACPGCKEATSEQGANIARGFSYSILFMMPLPFIIVGSFGGYVYYTVRRRERETPGDPAALANSLRRGEPLP